MGVFDVVKPICLILVCQLAGEVLARASGWPVPGPVIGFIGLFLLLVFLSERSSRGGGKVLDPSPAGSLGKVSDTILPVLGLLFVPAGVGIVDRGALFAAHWIELIAVLVLSVLATLLATVAVFLGVARLFPVEGGDG